MRVPLFTCLCRVMTGIGLMLGGVESLFADDMSGASSLTVTNIRQLRGLAAENPSVSYLIRLEGNVWWAKPAEGRLVLQDSSGAAELEVDLQGQPVQAGQRVRLEGNGTIAKQGAGFKLGVTGPVVDNDGLHGMVEKSGAAYLKAGRHPIRLEWFNGVEKYGLEVDYAGPGLPRQAIPDAALFRDQMNVSGGSNLVNGLDYRCCEAAGEVLPDFTRLPVLKSGTVSNFDLGVMIRDEHIGLQFTGCLVTPRDGLYTFYTKSDDGSRLFVAGTPFMLQVTGQAAFPEPRHIATGQTWDGEEEGQWVRVEGKVTFVRQQPDGLQMELSAGTGRMRVEVADGTGLPANLLNSQISATGFCESAFTTDRQKIAGVLLVPGGKEIRLIESFREAVENTNAGALTLLTTAAAVHRLKREDAQRGYPVKIQGVVTCVLPEHQGFTLEDSTRGLYIVDSSESRPFPPQIGENLEVEGYTDPSLFAPIVNANKVNSLGAGQMPEPVHPTWDQLMNGSLDAQYVEIQGVITAIGTNGVVMLTRGGTVKVELRVAGLKPEELRRYEDALVRVRGVLFASWDYLTHEVKVGEIRIYGAAITTDQPVPVDLFSNTPEKTAAELLLFDPQAGTFQRVKVSGQIVYARDPEYFMMQGGSGLRFIAKNSVALQAGDEVDVVGFPELFGNASPVLREAVARKTGHAALPAAKELSASDFIRAGYDSIRVQVDGTLVNVKSTPAGQELEMQNGVRNFVARLNGEDNAVQSLAIGSRLELTGVYAAQGGNRVSGQSIASFELLLDSPAEIKVLARPPWWTLERMLIIVGALAFVLVITALWITQLHRKVEERTAQLEAQIRERQFIEQQRAMEQERARVAKDLHDELGSGLTEISMLVTVAHSSSNPGNGLGPHLAQIGDRAGQMVTALDEIVWAMNPKHDSLASLVSYSCLYADRFLKLANIGCRLKGAVDLPDRMVNSAYRHEFFLAFKEALTNVVRHSGATEVRLGVQLIGDRLRLSIADNGGGLAADVSKEGSDGLLNMRARLQKMGGRFEIASKAGRGTTLRFYMPLS